MARNGSGTFTRIVPAYVFDTVISETSVNSEMDDIATALTASLAKDGQTVPTANLPMGGYGHTGVRTGTARTDYAALGQVQDGSANWVDGGGTADVITATYSPVITALVDGQLCFVRATLANATTTPTFNPSGLGAGTIVKNGGVALAAGDIVGDGHQLILRYDLAGTQWELLNPAVAAASDTAAGIVELATTAETTTGTDATRAVTPDGLHDMTSLAGAAWFLDEDTMSSDSATQVPSQQSCKAYVDASVATASPSLGTESTATGGTSIDFTSIPAGTKRIIVSGMGLSSTGTSRWQIQLGDSGGVEVTGYVGSASNAAGSATALFSSGLLALSSVAAASEYSFQAILVLENAATNAWSFGCQAGRAGTATNYVSAGRKALSAALDTVRLTTEGGADTFDVNGGVNIMYEG